MVHWIDYKINFLLRIVVLKKKKPTGREEQKKNQWLGHSELRRESWRSGFCKIKRSSPE